MILNKRGISKEFTSDTSSDKRIGTTVKLITVSKSQTSRRRDLFDIQSLLINANQISITATIHNINDSSQILRRTYADLLIIDVDFTGAKSTALISMAKKIQPHIDVIVIANTIESKHLVQSIAAGAIGYISKADASLNIVSHLRDFLHSGKPPFSNETVQQILTVLKKSQNCASELTLLTLRETEILTVFAKGYTYKATARKLSISTNTVPSHIKNIYRKLGVNSRSEAVFEALQRGLIQLG